MITYRPAREDYALMVGLICTGCMVALLESLGIAIFMPLLQGGTALGGLNIPFPFNQVYDYFGRMPLNHRVQVIAGLLVAIHLTRIGLLHFNIKLSLKIREHIVKYYQMACIKQLMHVGMSYFNKKKSSDFQLMFETHIGSSIGLIVELICDSIPSVFTTIFLIVLLFFFSWPITLISIVLVVSASLALNFLSTMVRKSGEDFVKTKSDFNKVLFDIINGMKVLRLFSAEQHCQANFALKADGVNHTYERMSRITRSIGPIFEAIGIMILAAILFFGTWFIHTEDSSTTMAFLLTFLIIIARLIPPLKQFNNARGIIITRLPVFKEVEDFLHAMDKDCLVSGPHIFKGLEHKIELHGVNFGYDPNRCMVLQQMSFEIEKGTKVGIVGASGSGKSTIAELLLRFYDPQQGQITVDGHNLKDLDIRSWRLHIGVVSQDTFLLHDTIKANITFADPHASMEDIERAARRAHAHEFICQLPQGYETVIGDRGVLLSGGQRQRIAIARAILCEPDILIFDEATSALDTASERIVQQTLDEISKGKTVVTIAHRLSTVMDSHKIIVLHEGQVVEQGTHQELLQKGGLYKKFVGIQHLEVSKT